MLELLQGLSIIGLCIAVSIHAYALRVLLRRTDPRLDARKERRVRSDAERDRDELG